METSEWKVKLATTREVATCDLAGASGYVSIAACRDQDGPFWEIYVMHSATEFVPHSENAPWPKKEALEYAILRTKRFLKWLKSQRYD